MKASSNRRKRSWLEDLGIVTGIEIEKTGGKSNRPDSESLRFAICNESSLGCLFFERTFVERHFNCLEMVHIRTTRVGQLPCVCAILLEIWPSGGVVQTDKPLVKGEKFMIQLDGGEIEVEVQDCETDIYGCYIRFAIDNPWLPISFQPSYLKLDDSAARVG